MIRLFKLQNVMNMLKAISDVFLIDTSRSGIFLDFGLYFELNPQLDCKVTTVINDDIFDRLNSCLSVKPFEFKGMIRDVA